MSATAGAHALRADPGRRLATVGRAAGRGGDEPLAAGPIEGEPREGEIVGRVARGHIAEVDDPGQPGSLRDEVPRDAGRRGSTPEGRPSARRRHRPPRRMPRHPSPHRSASPRHVDAPVAPGPPPTARRGARPGTGSPESRRAPGRAAPRALRRPARPIPRASRVAPRCRESPRSRARPTTPTGSPHPRPRARPEPARAARWARSARRVPGSTRCSFRTRGAARARRGSRTAQSLAEAPDRAVPAVSGMRERQGRGIRNRRRLGGRPAHARAPRRSRARLRACRAWIDATGARRAGGLRIGSCFVLVCVVTCGNPRKDPTCTQRSDKS